MLDILRDNGYEKRIFVSKLNFSHAVAQGKLTESVNFIGPDSTIKLRFLYSGNDKRNLLWLSHLFSEHLDFINLFSGKDPRDFDYINAFTGLSENFEYIIRSIRGSKSPVFVWSHIMDTHPPSPTPEKFKAMLPPSGEDLIDELDGSILYADMIFGRFYEEMKHEGLLDNTIIIVSADHGFYPEKNLLKSNKYVYNPRSILKIPLIIHEPGQTVGKIIQTPAEQVDIKPTILELAGIQDTNPGDGESLVPYMKNASAISNKIKICISPDYIYKYSLRLYFKSRREGDDFKEQFFVSYKNYLFELLISKDENGQPVFKCQGIYDSLKDPNLEQNIVQNEELKPILKFVLDNPKLKSYLNL